MMMMMMITMMTIGNAFSYFALEFFYDDYACMQDGQDGLGVKMLLSYCHNFVDLYDTSSVVTCVSS